MTNGHLNAGAKHQTLVPLSPTEGLAIYDLLMHGCKLHYQQGKVRIHEDPQVQFSHLIRGNSALHAPTSCDSIGVDVGSLPLGTGILDLDNASFTQSIKDALSGHAGISMERTPSGGLHLWGRGIREHTQKNGICAAGLCVEYFLSGRITIIGVGRSIIQWSPLKDLAFFPAPLLPSQGDHTPQILELIPLGHRWNRLYEQVLGNPSLDKEVLSFQARFLCNPPLEASKENDLQGILQKKIEKRAGQGLNEGESLEENVSHRVAQALAHRWIFRLPDKEWYAYANGHWSTHEGACYDIMNDIEEALGLIKVKFAASHRKRMGTLQFRRLMEECLKERLYKAPKPYKGVHFVNGLLVVKGSERELQPPEPGLWSFQKCGIELSMCTRLTDAQKTFLLELTDGCPLKLNVLRAYLRLLFTNDNREQFLVYLWGPGATGKSTLVQLLEYILGDAACTLDLLRLTNRFEMKVVQDKLLITLPDIPTKVNDAQCSMIKKFVSGDKVVVEIKNGSIYGVSIGALMLVTSNTRWSVQDRTSGFRRRVLYLLTPKSVSQRDPYLLEKLKVDASGLVNWALDMPDSKTRIGPCVDAINELSGGGVDSSGIMEWLFAEVRHNPYSEAYLGAKKVPLPGGLFEAYTRYTETHGIEPSSYYSFGDVLEDLVRSMGYRDIYIKRRERGRVVIGVSLTHGKSLNRNRRTDIVQDLLEDEPWEGFRKDKELLESSAGGDVQSPRENGERCLEEDRTRNRQDPYSLTKYPKKIDRIDRIDRIDSFILLYIRYSTLH